MANYDNYSGNSQAYCYLENLGKSSKFLVKSFLVIGFIGFLVNLLPYHAFLTKIGGMKALSLPDLSITSKSTKNLKKTQKMRREFKKNPEKS